MLIGAGRGRLGGVCNGGNLKSLPNEAILRCWLINVAVLMIGGGVGARACFEIAGAWPELMAPGGKYWFVWCVCQVDCEFRRGPEK